MSTKKFLLTGPPGCGKTTLVKKVCRTLEKQNVPVYGFFTEELRERGKRVGFDVVTLDGSRGVLARVIDQNVKHNGPIVGQYGVNMPSFENTALPVISKQELGVVVIDEIGKMELFSKLFSDRVLKIFLENKVVLATIPIRPLPFVNKLKTINSTSQEIIEVNNQNRDALELQLVEKIKTAYS